jgi:hypothetical protein
VKRVLLASGVMAMLVGLTVAGQRRLALSEAERLVRAAISDKRNVFRVSTLSLH